MVRLNLQLFALNKAVMMADTGSGGNKNNKYVAGPSASKKAQVEANANAKKTSSTTQKTSSTTQKTSSSSNSNVSSGVSGTVQPTYTPFYASANTQNAQKEANKYLNEVKRIASITDIIDQKTWDKLNTNFATSDAYNEAMAFTNSLLDKLSSGKTSYTDQIKDLMGQIQNREDFEYDVESDTLFQQALASAMSSGKTAMQDTIGQASALTGGYGSTYATSAGNQAYNSYIEDAYNNLPEYYQMALEAYQMEGQEMYNQLAMLNQADSTEYQRMYDSWNANFTNAQNMYNQEYGAWQDSINNAYNSANLQLKEHGQLFDQAYNTYNATQNHANTLYSQEYQKWADEVANAFKSAEMYNSNYWNNQNFIQRQNEFNAEMAYKQNALAQEMAYKNSALAQDQAQFEASLNARSLVGGADSNGNLTGDASLTNAEINALVKGFNGAGGGTAGYDWATDYLKGIGKYQNTEEFNSLIDTYLSTADAQVGVPVWNQTWTISKDTKNHNNPFKKGNEDYNDKYTNLNGETLSYKELKKQINNSPLPAEQKKALLKSLASQSTK